jgi:hypothetical protein
MISNFIIVLVIFCCVIGLVSWLGDPPYGNGAKKKMNPSLKAIIWIFIIIVSAVHLVSEYSAHKREENDKIAQSNIVNLSASQMISRWDADASWESKLKVGKKVRKDSIRTAELENAWIHHKPIFFNGFVKDIKNHNETHYEIVIERMKYIENQYAFVTGLQLLLIVDKVKIDSLAESHQGLLDGLNNNYSHRVGVVAKIEKIETSYDSDNDGSRNETKIGKGTMTDIIYTGSLVFDLK